MPRMKTSLLLGAAAIASGIVIGAIVNAVAQSPGVNSPFNPVWSIPLDSIKRTYTNVTQLSPGGFATDIYQICGSASATTKVTRISIGGSATAVSPLTIFIVKRSNWDTGGTVVNGVSTIGIPVDANDAAGTAAVTAYTGTSSPTLGTLVGVIAAATQYFGNLTTGLGYPQYNFDWGNRPAKAPTLRGATQCLAVNLSGTSQGGNLLSISSEWTEE